LIEALQRAMLKAIVRRGSQRMRKMLWRSVAILGVLFVLLLSGRQKQVVAGSADHGDSHSFSVAQNVSQSYALPPAQEQKAKQLAVLRVVLELVGTVWSCVLLWLLLTKRRAAKMQAWIAGRLKKKWLEGLAFFAALLLVMAVAGVPLQVMGHAAALHFGISVEGWGAWALDQAKAHGMSLLIGAPVLLLFHWIVRKSPCWYWLWSWLAVLPLMLLGVILAPLVDPVFNHFEPLSLHHAALVRRLEEVVARTGTKIPPERMYLMKASEKWNGINAYVTGIGGTKRFVMWDTATDRMPDDEVLFIFGHESGHYVLNHIPKEMAGIAAGLLLIFALGGYCGQKLIAAKELEWWLRTGDERGAATRQGFLALIFVFMLLNVLAEPAANAWSRHFEHEADVYGQESIHGLVTSPQQTAVGAFQHLGAAWLEDPDPNPIVEFWTASHPSVQRRTHFASEYDPWANGGRGRFFAR